MDYPLARLGSREFEHLLQSLCKARLGPRVEAFGDGPDGGRDAVIRGRVIWSEDDVWDGYIIMQAKFRQRPLGTDLDTKWFTEQVESELKNWVAYQSRGTRKLPDYLLFTTNVVLAGTSGGGIEKVSALITRYAPKLGGLKGWRVWHYDDIRGELDNAPGVRAAFGLTTPGEVAAEIATRLVEQQKKAAGRSDLMDGFPGLTGVDTGAVSAFDRALTGVLAAHREACTLSDEDDPWLLPAFEETVLRHMLGALRGIYAGQTGSADVVTPAERLLLHVIPLYIDAVLRLEHSSRLTELRNLNGDPGDRVARTDLERAFAEAPTIADRLRNASSAGGEREEHDVDALQRWVAHQATLRSPSIWDDRAAHLLAETMAALLDERDGGPQQELADLVRRIGRHAVYDVSDFDDSPHALRMPLCPMPLEIRPATVAWFSRFFWQAALDPRVVGRRVAEHVGMRAKFDLDQAVRDLRAAQWMTTETGIDIDAVCSDPATAHALIDHAHQVDEEIRRLRHETPMPIFRRLRADEQRIRPRSASGMPQFQLPLTELGMSQDQIRQLLMGTALYGRPGLAIREMYQNSMDACRRRAMRRSYLHAEGRGPAAPYAGKVTIRQRTLDAGRVCIECVDNGTGIPRDELRAAFAQAGRRFTDLASFRDEQAQWLKADTRLRLYPNSRFGIGVFSYFMLSNEFTVETVPEDSDGTRGEPLRVLVSAPSGLLTIRHLDDVPEEIAFGGTIVRLYLDSRFLTDQSDETISVLSVLEELIGVTELHLTVEEDGYVPREWRPLELGPANGGPTKLAFESENCRGWWTLSSGAVLVDGIKSDVDLPGLLVDLRGAHAPRIRADRNKLVDWDQPWVIDQFIAAADTVADWEDVTLQWLWQVSVVWPKLGENLFDVMRDRNPEVAVGLGLSRQTRVDLRTVGVLPADITKRRFPLQSILNSPFSPPPSAVQYWRPVNEDEYSINWPYELRPWQRHAWSVALNDTDLVQAAFGDGRRSEYPSSIGSVDGYPVPGPIDVAIMSHPSSLYDYSTGFGRPIEPISLAAGAARSGIDLGEAVRRIRRFHIAGLSLPDVDARNLADIALDSALLDALMRAIGISGEEAGYVEFWIHSAIIAAYESRRPLADIQQLLKTLSRIGLHEELFVGDSLHDRPPSLPEVQFFCQEENSLGGLADKLWNSRPRRAYEYQLMIQRYEPLLLGEYGMEADALRRIFLGNFTELERVAWSRNVEDDGEWIFGQRVRSAHFVRVAAKCGISLRDAQQLVMRCPGVWVSEGSQEELPAIEVAEDVEKLIGPIYASHGPYSQYNKDWPRFNAIIFSELARLARISPSDAARMLNDLPVQVIDIPDADWNFVDTFRPDRLQHLLLQEKGRVHAGKLRFSATRIGIAELADRATEVAESLPAVALSAHTLKCLGIQIEFPEPVPNIVPDSRDLTIINALSLDGVLGLPKLLVTLNRDSQTDMPSMINRIAMWMKWIWSDDHRLGAIFDALQMFESRPIAELDEFAINAISQMREISKKGSLARPHLIEISGALGISISILQSAVAPFRRFMELDGMTLPWFPDPTGTPPDWLDVAMVALHVAKPDLSAAWSDALADFLTANVMADEAEIRERYERWHDILAADTSCNSILPASAYDDGLPTGMLRWKTATEGDSSAARAVG